MLTRESAVGSEDGLLLVHIPLTVRGVSTAGLNSALPVRVRRRPVWNPSSTGDPVMVREGIGTERRKKISSVQDEAILIYTLNCDVE